MAGNELIVFAERGRSVPAVGHRWSWSRSRNL